ncbi:aldehyde dehydrogenase family protein [Streptomyces pluripotens]|uniref:aldehyde dehydrogenase family protein n=1 Tax=Streptomyces pluripotens TaxID=1355015 RepID=UPI0005735DE8|nr:aldehyde dehydrogenase family protein [Streptomyces pluripotens]ARP73416.1 hypothetical protein LK06_029445 [Streptomyces pluripotens]
MRIATEEIFGPVVTVTAFSSENEAAEIANGSDYGLLAGVYSRDSATAFRVARRLEVAMVFAQQLLPQHPRRPLRRHQAQRLRARARPRNTAHLPGMIRFPTGLAAIPQWRAVTDIYLPELGGRRDAACTLRILGVAVTRLPEGVNPLWRLQKWCAR